MREASRSPQIHGIPSSNSRHEQMQATRPVDVILKRSITLFSLPSKKELACQGMKHFPLVESNEHHQRRDSSRK